MLSTIAYGGGTIDTRAYDAGGRLSSETLGNGQVVTRTYLTGDNLPLAISNSAVGAYTYGWDANKNKTSEAGWPRHCFECLGCRATGGFRGHAHLQIPHVPASPRHPKRCLGHSATLRDIPSWRRFVRTWANGLAGPPSGEGQLPLNLGESGQVARVDRLRPSFPPMGKTIENHPCSSDRSRLREPSVASRGYPRIISCRFLCCVVSAIPLAGCGL